MAITTRLGKGSPLTYAEVDANWTGFQDSSGSSLVGFVQSGTGAIADDLQSRGRRVVYVQDYMTAAQRVDVAGFTAAIDVTAAIQAAENAFSGQVLLRMPRGKYLVSSEVTFDQDRTSIEGDGQQATIVQFAPTTTGVAAFHFKKSSAVTIAQCSIKGISFDATGNTQATKAALRVTDGEEIIIDDVAVSNWSSAGKDCIGLQFRGRQTHSIGRISITADIPISIEDNPNSTIDIDHYHFHDCYLIADTSQPCIKIADGVNLTHVTFDGYQAWVKGKYGIYWNDTTTTAASIAMHVENVRWEQETDATGYMFYISHNLKLEMLSLKNCYGGATGNGIYLRKCDYVDLDNIFYVGSGTAMNADSTCTFVSFKNVSFDNAAATVTLTATQLSGTYRLGGNITSLDPAPASNASVTQKWNPSASLGFSQIEPATFTVANASIAKFSTLNMQGMFFIYATVANVCAVMALTGATHSVKLLVQSDTGWFGTTAAAANFNVYYDAGNSQYTIQNNTVTSDTFYVVSMGRGDR